MHRDPEHLVRTLKGLRRCLDVNSEVSIVRDIVERELRLWTDAGRACRPLFIVEATEEQGMQTNYSQQYKE